LLNAGVFPLTTEEKGKTMKNRMGRLWAAFTLLCVLAFSPTATAQSITNNPAGDIADAVSSGVSIFNSVYAIVIAAVVLGFLLWVLSAVRRRR